MELGPKASLRIMVLLFILVIGGGLLYQALFNTVGDEVDLYLLGLALLVIGGGLVFRHALEKYFLEE
ncbi:hypothetical protein COY28_03410 [Candidatus Woesearchaeota archaeon CG_4_10_14_0_2_um_filter_57_5]|nr:MAG: hypothetical protein COY28_03410 [Candidatus Woesearchaeota archaeon CG_4_10_14_0_2_um_filter_57_5]